MAAESEAGLVAGKVDDLERIWNKMADTVCHNTLFFSSTLRLTNRFYQTLEFIIYIITPIQHWTVQLT